MRVLKGTVEGLATFALGHWRYGEQCAVRGVLEIEYGALIFGRRSNFVLYNKSVRAVMDPNPTYLPELLPYSWISVPKPGHPLRQRSTSYILNDPSSPAAASSFLPPSLPGRQASCITALGNHS